MADLSAHIDAIGHPNIKAMYDTFHANIEEADPIGAYHASTGRTSSTSIFPRTTAACPGAATSRGPETFAAIRKSGYDGWLTIESFGRGLKDLAAATKVWRDFAESPEAVYRDGYKHIRNGWRKAAKA